MAYTTIDDPSAYFQTTIYTGTGSDNTAITNVGNSDLQPDFIWIKKRSATGQHVLSDTNRGILKVLNTNSNAAEDSNSEGEMVKSVQSDGFTLGDSQAGQGDTNYTSGGTYVAWQWKANGGTTASNTDGSITSTVQANTTAGFSIVSYSGNGVNGATVGHGLGAQPEIIIIKRRNVNASGGGSNWPIRSTLLTAQQVIYLDLNASAGNSTTMFNNTYPNTTTFTIGDNEATNAYQTNHSFTGTYIAYCFKSIQGYSKFGSYTGNGNADGVFVYLGFKPAWIMYKTTDSTANHWTIRDNKRDPDNEVLLSLYANKTNADDSGGDNIAIDMLSNGFKARRTDSQVNESGTAYIYMAFAEHPFVSSEGVPTTAR